MARELGLTGREALYARLTAEELREWEALYACAPWGEARADLRQGIICSVLDACHRTRGNPRPPADYMPQFERQVKQKSTAELQAEFAVVKAAWDQARKRKHGQ
ncbi:MAG: phage tail assembly protein T [Planctomycetota bacterium]